MAGGDFDRCFFPVAPNEHGTGPRGNPTIFYDGLPVGRESFIRGRIDEPKISRRRRCRMPPLDHPHLFGDDIQVAHPPLKSC